MLEQYTVRQNQKDEKKMSKFAVFLLFACTVSACGNKGALYLPTTKVNTAAYLSVTDIEGK